MSRRSKPESEDELPATVTDTVSQVTPTPAPFVRQDGLQIDGFGLPVNRIARVKVLEELGADEPALGEPGAWNEANVRDARAMTEKLYG